MPLRIREGWNEHYRRNNYGCPSLLVVDGDTVTRIANQESSGYIETSNVANGHGGVQRIPNRFLVDTIEPSDARYILMIYYILQNAVRIEDCDDGDYVADNRLNMIRHVEETINVDFGIAMSMVDETCRKIFLACRFEASD